MNQLDKINKLFQTDRYLLILLDACRFCNILGPQEVEDPRVLED